MRFSHTFVPALLCCGSLLLGGPVAAQPSSSSLRESGREVRRGEADSDRYAPSEQPRLLQQALERYRAIERRGGWGKISTDRPMGPPYSYDCSQIAALEKRLIVEGYLAESSVPPPPPPVLATGRPASAAEADKKARANAEPERCKYGPALTAAVSAFQADRKVLGDGQIGALTKRELTRPVREIIDILEHDIERWRDVSLEPSGTFLLVNIPFFELTAYRDDREVLRMPVIVGQPSWQTPLFSDALEFLVVNPDWGIPDHIAKQEYWPSARRNPDYLRRQGITATGGSLRQKPGPRNPLGRIKFVMPNPYDVYLHDTPEQRAFSAAVRALSHGCIRLSQPMDLAHYLLRDDPQWSPSRLQTAIASGKTLQINLRRQMPVHIVYFTSWVNAQGRVELRPDVYRKDGDRAERTTPPGDDSLQAWP